MEARRGFRVQAARPLCDAMRAIDGDSPRQIRGRPVELLVEEVAPARDALREQRAGNHDVEPDGQRDLLPARVDEDAQHRAGHAAVQAKTGVRRQDRADGILGVERAPLVDHVIKPTAGERQRANEQQRVPDVVGVVAAPRRFVLGDEQEHGQTDDVANAVPANAQRPDLEQR